MKNKKPVFVALTPCPACQSEEIKIFEFRLTTDTPIFHYAKCTECGLQADCAPTRKGSIMYWHRIAREGWTKEQIKKENDRLHMVRYNHNRDSICKSQRLEYANMTDAERSAMKATAINYLNKKEVK